MPAFSPFLALRYLLTRPITALGVFGVSFAVWAMLVVDAVFTGFVADIRDNVQRSTAPLLVTDLPHDTGYEQLRAAIEADPAVGPEHSAPRLRHYGLLQARRASRLTISSSEVDWNHMLGGFALLLGIDPDREARVTGLRAWLDRAVERFRERGVNVPPSEVLDEPDPARRARMLSSDATEWNARRRLGLPAPPKLEDFRSEWPGVLLSWRRLYYTQARPGEPIDLVLAAVLPDGSVRTSKVPLAFAGCFATDHRLFDETAAILPIETLRTELGNDVNQPGSIDLVTDVAVRPHDGLSAGELRLVQRRLQAAVQAKLPPGSPPCSVLDWEQQNAVYLDAVSHEHKMMQFVLFVVMLVAGFVIYATLHMMVVQKWKDIGILAAIGGSPRGIGLVFVACGFTVGAFGTLAGTGVGVLSVHYLNDVNDWLARTLHVELFPKALFDLDRVPCRLESSWVLQVGVGAMLLSLLVAFVPARKAARMNPVKALSYE